MFRRRGGSSSDDSNSDRLDETEAEEPQDAEAVAEEGDMPEDTDADLESQAADYLADNDQWLYGANARDVLDVLDFLEEIAPEDAETIAEAWRNAPKSDREAARKAARKIMEGEGDKPRQVRMAREEVGAWLAVAADFPEYTKSVQDWARTASTVSEAALDAVTALILDEDLDEPNYQALSAPWNEALDAIEVRNELEEVEGVPAVDEDEEADEDEEGAEDEGKFGPNSDAVEDFLNRLWLLSPEQIARLVSGWEEQPESSLQLAHDALLDLVEDEPDLRDQVRSAQEKVSPWLNGGRLEETASFIGQTGASTSRRRAGPALADAVAALVVGDLLAPEDAEVLYAPWFNLVGAPPLPETAEDEPDETKN